MRHRIVLAAAALAAACHLPAQAQVPAQPQTHGGPGCAELARIVQLLPGGPQVFPAEAAPGTPAPTSPGTPPGPPRGAAPNGPPGTAPASAPTGPVRTSLLLPGALRATVSATPGEVRYVTDLYETGNRRGGADRTPQVLRLAAERVAACYRGVRPTREPNGTAEDNTRFTVAPGTEIAVLLENGTSNATVSLAVTRRARR